MNEANREMTPDELVEAAERMDVIDHAVTIPAMWPRLILERERARSTAPDVSDADDLLRPFAAMGGDWAMPPFHDLEADVVVWESAGKYVTAGDVRDARRYLESKEKK